MAVYEKDRLPWIEEAINSILEQTYRDFVLVIVIDGYVSDEVSLLLTKFDSENIQIKLVQSVLNVGLSACMNFVVQWALQLDAQYFFRMDSDDISTPDRFEKQISFLQQHPEVSVLGTALDEINEEGKVVGSRMLPLAHEDIIKFLPKRCSINHPTVVIRCSVFKAGFRYREEYRNIEDYFLWAELAANGFTFTNLSDRLLKFRRANDFYVRRGVSKSVSEFRARLYAMKVLHKTTFGNYLYAVLVLILRLMPTKIIKLAYKIDRLLLEKIVKH